MQIEESSIEDFLENNPTFSIDFLYYCDDNFKRIIHENQKKKARKEYQHRYYIEVTKKKREQKRKELL